jgi:hypothetical protein
MSQATLPDSALRNTGMPQPGPVDISSKRVEDRAAAEPAEKGKDPQPRLEALIADFDALLSERSPTRMKLRPRAHQSLRRTAGHAIPWIKGLAGSFNALLF